MPRPPNSKRATESSKKKRTRKELEESDTDDPPSSALKATKRPNTSNTPVRESSISSSVGIPPALDIVDGPKLTSQDVPIGTVPPPPFGDASAEETAESLDTAPPNIPLAQKKDSPSTTAKAPSVASPVVKASDVATQHTMMEDMTETWRVAPDKRKLWMITWVSLLLFSVVMGMWLSERISNRLATRELRQELQNYKVLLEDSVPKAKDEFYLNELESEIQLWRQTAREKGAALEGLRTECEAAIAEMFRD